MQEKRLENLTQSNLENKLISKTTPGSEIIRNERRRGVGLELTYGHYIPIQSTSKARPTGLVQLLLSSQIEE